MHRAPAPLQPELLLTDNADSDMRFAARLIGQVQRELSQQRRYHLRTLARWLDLFEYVKMLEEEHLDARDPVRGRTEFFLATLSIVSGLGRLLQTKLSADEADQIPTLGLTFQDLVACVEELEDTHRALRSDMTPAQAAQIEAAVFGSANS